MCTAAQSNIATLAPLFSAIATFAVVLVALFRDEIRRNLFHLRLEYGRAEPFVIRRGVSGALRSDVRLRLANRTWIAARNVQVIINAIGTAQQPMDAGEFGPRPRFALPDPSSVAPPGLIAPKSHCFVTLASFTLPYSEASLILPPNGHTAIALPRQRPFELILDLTLSSETHAYEHLELCIGLTQAGDLYVHRRS